MMTNIGVDCVFSANGSVQVRRIEVDGRWLAVGQGRQWLAVDGRHVLVMLPGDKVRELVFRSDTLVWYMKKSPVDHQRWV